MPGDPLDRLEEWLAEAREGEDPARSAMTLATAGGDGIPSARIVLLKGVEDGALVFGTTLRSRAGTELRAQPRVALVLFWPTLARQVRVDGRAELCSAADSDRVWAERGRDGRLVDLVSDRGAPLADPDELARALREEDARRGDDLPLPGDWAAVRVVPDAIELWSAGERNLAVRERYERTGDGWRVTRLQP